MKKKIYAVMSSAALTTAISSAISTTAFAAVDGFLVNNNDKLFLYNYNELMEDSLNKLLGDSSPLYDEYIKGNLVAFHDTIKGYVNEKDVMDQSLESLMDGKNFDLDSFTESAKDEQIYKIEGKNVTERIFDEKKETVVDKKEKEVKAELKVESVSAINETTLEVTLAAAPAKAPVVGDFVVKVNGTVKQASKVEKVAADLTNTKYRLTVTSLKDTEGSLDVNGTLGKYDYKAPEVKSIVTKDSKHIVVNFNEELNADSIVKGRFTVAKVAEGAAPTVEAAVLNADKQSVTLTLGTAELVPADYVLKLGKTTNKIEDVAKNGIYVGTEVSFKPTAAELENKNAPAFANATYNNVSGVLTVKFDKAIKDSLLDITKLSVNDVKLNTADVNTDATEDETITVKLSDATKKAVNALIGDLTLKSEADAYGILVGTDKVLTKGETVSISKETPAVIKEAAYNQETNKLTLTFDQAVKFADLATKKIYLDTNATSVGGITEAAVPLTAAMLKDATLTQATWVFDLGATGATLEGLKPAPTSDTLKVYMDAASVINGAKVANLDTQKDYDKGIAVAYTADVTKPSLLSAQYNNISKELKLTFSENVSQTLADITKANIKVMSDASTEIINLSTVAAQGDIVEDANAKTLTFKLKNNDNAGATDLHALGDALEAAYNTGKSMKVVLDGTSVQDEAKLSNDKTTFDTGIALVVKDYQQPQVDKNALADDTTHVTVKFNKKVDKATAETAANYVIKDSTGAVLEVKSAVLMGNGKEVLLTTVAQEAGKPYNITVSNVTDLQKNMLDKDKGTAKFNGKGTAQTGSIKVTAAADIKTVENSANDTIELSFTDSKAAARVVDTVTATNLDNYTILEKGTKDDYSDAKTVDKTGAKVVVDAAEGNKVKITLGAANLTNGQEYKVVVQNVQDKFGNVLLASANFAKGIAAGDAALVAPEVKEYQVAGTGNDYIELVFAEELDQTTATDKSKYTVDVDGNGTNDVVAATYSWDATNKKATVKLTLAGDLASARDVVINGVKDLAGNALNETVVASNVQLMDAVKPTVTKVEGTANEDEGVGKGKGNDTIKITFSERVREADAVNAANYEISINGGEYVKLSDFIADKKLTLDALNNVVTITLNSAVDKDVKALVAGTSKLSVKVSNVRDLPGNVIDTVAISGDVTTAGENPNTTKAEVTTPYSIDVTFNKELDASTVSKDDFVIEYTDGTVKTVDIKSVELNDKAKVVTLNTVTPLVAGVEYTVKPSDSSSIASVVGKLAEGTDKFTKQPATLATATAPNAAAVKEKGNVNAANTINNNNKAAVEVKVDFEKQVTGTVEVKLTDADGKFVTKTAPINNKEDKTVDVTGIDASSLKDGNITVSATLTTTNGVTSSVFTGTQAKKDTVAPSNAGITINAFDDTDLDANQIAGNITFTKATDDEDIAKYVVKVENTDVKSDINKDSELKVVVPENKEVNGGTPTITIVAVDEAGNASEAVTLTIQDKVKAATIDGHAVAKGTKSNATKITYAATEGNTLAYVVSDSVINVPLVGSIPEGITVYTSGADIQNVAKNKHVGLYELKDGKVVKFVDITLTAEQVQ